MRVLQERGDPPELMVQKLGEMCRQVLCFALIKIDQDRGDSDVLMRQIDACYEIRLVLLGRQRVRLEIRSRFRQRVNGKAPGIADEARVGMQRNEQIRVIRPRDLETWPKCDKLVTLPGQL